MGSLLSCSLLISLLLVLAASNPVNQTIDDDLRGSSVTLNYQPPNGWALGQTCSSCGINTTNVDLNVVHGRTWHDATARVGDNDDWVQVGFTGSAVYVFNLIANIIDNGYVTTFTNLTFHIDGDQVGSYTHEPDNSAPAIQYNVCVYQNTTLPHGQHQLEMRSASITKDSLILFDYIIYTTQDNTVSVPPSNGTANGLASIPADNHTSTPSPTPLSSTSSGLGNRIKIIVGVVSAMSGAAVAVVLVILIRRKLRNQTRRQKKEQHIDPRLGDSACQAVNPYEESRRSSVLVPSWSPAPSPAPSVDSRSSLLSWHSAAEMQLPATASMLISPTCPPTPSPPPPSESPRGLRSVPPTYHPDVPTSVFSSTESNFSLPVTMENARERRIAEAVNRLSNIQRRLDAVDKRSAARRGGPSQDPNRSAGRHRPRPCADVPAPALSISGTEASARVAELREKLRGLEEQRREAQLSNKRRMDVAKLKLVNPSDDTSDVTSVEVARENEAGSIETLDEEIEAVNKEIMAHARLVEESLPRNRSVTGVD